MERERILKKLGVQETVLDNGFKILTKHIRGMKTVRTGIAARFGSIYENDEINGIAHFFEHMLFKGTENRGQEDILGILDELGGDSNAYTTWDNVFYYITTLNKYFPKAVDLLADLVLNPIFNKKDIETERGVILQEIAMHEDDPWNVADELLYQGLYRKNPIRRKILGSAENIERFSRQDFIKIHQEWYAVNNLFLVVVGGMNHREVVEQTKKYFEDKIPGSIPVFAKVLDEPIRRKRIIVKKPDLTEAKLFLGLRAPHFDNRDFYAMKVIASILGTGWTSRLKKEIREKRGWSYDTEAHCESSLVHSALITCTNLSNRKIREVEPIIIKELNRLRNEKVPKDELKRHINSLITDHIIYQEKNRASFWFSQILEAEIRNYFEALIEGIRSFKKITQKDILRVANEYLDAKNYVIAVVRGNSKSKALQKL